MSITYEMISDDGKKLILVEGHTFIPAETSGNHWECSSLRSLACKATLCLDDLDRLVYCSLKHNHPPDAHEREEAYLRNQHYEIIRNRKGSGLILYKGYTFWRRTNRRWYCSSTRKNKCPSTLYLTNEGQIVYSLEHNHQPPPLHIGPHGELYKL
ncbi:hypothetical protein JYU34_004377 [Plutella xylostella]|uniref:FLYWCH-type domain-containing protein n=1 Tax=Plutella xylostella TaxID=51655 RepID=A0ABQ7QXV0_PLUXY|nr:hypothetical protein JYU34_004377 [Plutella xylostella]